MVLKLFIVLGVIAAGSLAVTINDCSRNLPRDNRLRAHGNSCYIFLLDHKREFNSAERECETRGGHLVIIRDLDTQRFLYNTLKHEFHYNGVVWIGLSDQRSEGNFVWVDGSQARFTYWAHDQPSIFGRLKDCVAMDTYDGGKWRDYRCTDLLFFHHSQTFVCEYPAIKRTTMMTTPKSTTRSPFSTPRPSFSTTRPPFSTTRPPFSTTRPPFSTMRSSTIAGTRPPTSSTTPN